MNLALTITGWPLSPKEQELMRMFQALYGSKTPLVEDVVLDDVGFRELVTKTIGELPQEKQDKANEVIAELAADHNVSKLTQAGSTDGEDGKPTYNDLYKQLARKLGVSDEAR